MKAIWIGVGTLALVVVLFFVDAATSGGNTPRAQISELYLSVRAGAENEIAAACASGQLRPKSTFPSVQELPEYRLVRTATSEIREDGTVTLRLVLRAITSTRLGFIRVESVPAERELVLSGKCVAGRFNLALQNTTIDQKHLPRGMY